MTEHPAEPTNSAETPRSARILVVGDLHGQWREADARFLVESDPDVVLFVGDLGDEDVRIARRIADLPVRKAVILGNHDAWESFRHDRVSSALGKSLDVLGEEHIGYDVLDLPEARVSVIGCRPFSWGGPSLRSEAVYEDLYGVTDMRSSADRILEAVERARFRDLILLAHNGPKGLGKEPFDIYGKDFGSPGGDWGDRDLQIALREIPSLQRRVQCVLAGHMHHMAMRPKKRERIRFVTKYGTKFCNPAVVPRLVPDGEGGRLGYFLALRITDGKVDGMRELWVDGEGEVQRKETPAFVQRDEGVEGVSGA